MSAVLMVVTNEGGMVCSVPRRWFIAGVFLCMALSGCANKYAVDAYPLDEGHLRRFVAEQNIQPLDTLQVARSTIILRRDPAGVGCYAASQRGSGEIVYGYERTGVVGGHPIDSGAVLAVMMAQDEQLVLCLVINDSNLQHRTSRVTAQFDVGPVTVPLNQREGVIIVAPASQRSVFGYRWIALYDANGQELYRKVPQCANADVCGTGTPMQ